MKLIPPHYTKYLNVQKDHENGEYRSPINPWQVHHSQQAEYNKVKVLDVELSKAIHDSAAEEGLLVKMMENPDFRIDYGTITSGHLVNPKWDKPIVCISSNRSKFGSYSFAM